MRTYIDIDTFSEWTSEEQYQFTLAVTKGLIMDMVRKAMLSFIRYFYLYKQVAHFR